MLKVLVVIACLNGVNAKKDYYVKQLAAVDADIAAGNYGDARERLEMMPRSMADKGIRMRMSDMLGLLALRAPKEDEKTGWVLTHFRDQQKANPKDARYKAWLAEAFAHEGNAKQALALLEPLKAKDLMPDAFAYLVLARLSTGDAQTEALEACKTRAKAKTICVL